MNTPIPRLFHCGIGAASLMAASALMAQEESTTLALWTFEEWTEELERSQEVGPISSEIGNGSAFGWHADAETNWRSRVGNGSSRSLDSHRWAEGDYFEFQVATTGFHSLQLSWDMRRTSTGPEEWLLGYSTDGATFQIHQTFEVGTAEWRSGSTSSASSYEADLSGIVDLDDRPTAFFRILAATDAESPNGAARIDNFAVNAAPAPIPEPATAAILMGLGAVGLVSARAAARRRAKKEAFPPLAACHGRHGADETSQPNGSRGPDGSTPGSCKT